MRAMALYLPEGRSWITEYLEVDFTKSRDSDRNPVCLWFEFLCNGTLDIHLNMGGFCVYMENCVLSALHIYNPCCILLCPLCGEEQVTCYIWHTNVCAVYCTVWVACFWVYGLHVNYYSYYIVITYTLCTIFVHLNSMLVDPTAYSNTST